MWSHTCWPPCVDIIWLAPTATCCWTIWCPVLTATPACAIFWSTWAPCCLINCVFGLKIACPITVCCWGCCCCICWTWCCCCWTCWTGEFRGLSWANLPGVEVGTAGLIICCLMGVFIGVGLGVEAAVAATWVVVSTCSLPSGNWTNCCPGIRPLTVIRPSGVRIIWTRCGSFEGVATGVGTADALTAA